MRFCTAGWSGRGLRRHRVDVVDDGFADGIVLEVEDGPELFLGTECEEVVVGHRPRSQGESKYGIGRTFRVIIDLMTVKFLLSYSSRPLQIFGSAGLLMGSVGLFFGAYLTWVKFGLGQAIGGRPLLLLASLLMLGGLQLVSLGLIGELLVRLNQEARHTKPYAIREILGDDD